MTTDHQPKFYSLHSQCVCQLKSINNKIGRKQMKEERFFRIKILLCLRSNHLTFVLSAVFSKVHSIRSRFVYHRKH